MMLFRYPPYKIIFPYALILIMPLTSVYIWFSFGLLKFGILFNAIYWGFNIGLGGIIAIWIANNLSVRISVDDQGISSKSFFRNLYIKWQDVDSVRWRILYEGRNVDSQKPSDITILSRDGNKMYVYAIVQQVGGDNGGITELEAFIRARVPSINGSKEKQIKSESRRQLRLAVVAGILIFICGVIFFQKPINPNKEKLGFISKHVGMSADAIVLMIGGIGLVGWGVNRLRKPNE